MRTQLLIAAFCLGLAASACAQNEELPSAPSAAKLPKPAPKPVQQPTPAPPGQPPQNAAPAKPAGQQDVVPTDPNAQPPKTTTTEDASSDITTIRRQVSEVNVVFTVTDKRGHFIKDLKQDDIQVLDDKRPPQQVVSFRAETDLPLRVGLVIDASNSIRERFRFEQEAAVEFLSQIVRPKKDKGFVLGFDSTVEVTQDFTDSTEKLTNGVRLLRPGGGTALYDAVYYVCRDKLAKIDPEMSVRRAIVLVSDGDDNQSRATREEAIEMAQRAEVIIYAISTNITGNVGQRGDKVLERMAEATGGRAFFPFKDQDIPGYFNAIQDELRSQYAVSYRPADFQRDGRYRSIDIVAQKKKDLHVRSRKGYFAPRQ